MKCGDIGNNLIQLHPLPGKDPFSPAPILERHGSLALHRYPGWIDGPWVVSRLSDGVRVYEFVYERVARTFLERYGENPSWEGLIPNEVDEDTRDMIQDWVMDCALDKPSCSVKRTSPRRRGRQPRSDMDETVLEKIQAVVASSGPGGASKSDVLNQVDLTDGNWNQVINILLERKEVVRTGAKKGARYHAKEN